MKYDNIIVENNNGILLLTVNREKAYNALNQATLADIRDVFENHAPNINLKGVIITGAGNKAFAAGADIKELASLSPSQGRALSQNGQEIFFLIENFNKPVVAAVNGFCLGAGCELAMACHMRIAGEKAKFGQPEVNLGLIPGYGATQRLTQLVGKAKSMELHLTGDMIKADEALRLGLVNHVVTLGDEVAKATEIIEKIATKAPLAIAKAIASVNAYYDKTKEGFSYEIDRFEECVGTADFKEGAAAFIGKRTPEFKGE